MDDLIICIVAFLVLANIYVLLFPLFSQLVRWSLLPILLCFEDLPLHALSSSLFLLARLGQLVMTWLLKLCIVLVREASKFLIWSMTGPLIASIFWLIICSPVADTLLARVEDGLRDIL
jgi:hypothetical protein